MALRRIALALVVLAAAAGLTACGVTRTVDPVAAAATKTEQAGGAKMSMTVAVTALGRTFTIKADGAFDGGQGELTMDLSDLLGSVGLPAGSGAGIKMLFVKENGDEIIYVQLPFLASRLPGGKSWIRLDLKQLGAKAGVDVGQLLNQPTQNPGELLDLLRASGQVEQVGPATINGVATTEYKGVIDLAKAAKVAGADDATIQRLLDSGIPTSVPVEVWVGDDGFVRRLEVTEDMTANGQSTSADVTVDLSDYGTPVSVTPPPADQVIDATSLAGLAPGP